MGVTERAESQWILKPVRKLRVACAWQNIIAPAPLTTIPKGPLLRRSGPDLRAKSEPHSPSPPVNS